jgi:hypothetical protein
VFAALPRDLSGCADTSRPQLICKLISSEAMSAQALVRIGVR